MASFRITLDVDSDHHDEDAVAEIFDRAMLEVADAHGMEVFDMTAYHIYTGRK